MSQGERHSKKDPLAELARLLEQDEAFRAVSRGRADAPVDWSQPQHEELQPLRSELVPAQFASDGWEATAPRGQAGAPDAGMHVVANYHEYGAGDEDIDLEGRNEKRGRIGVVAAVVAFIALAATAGTFGYFAWWSGPRVSDSGSMVAAEPSANKGLDGGTKALPRRSEGDLSTGEPALAGNGAPAERKATPPRQMLPATRGLTYGLAPTVGAVPTARDSGPPASSADARKVKSEAVPSQEGENGPRNPTLEMQPASGPSDASPAEQRATTPIGDPAPLIVGAKSPPADPGGEAPPVAANPVSGQGYIVQLSSQRSEKAAQATAQTLQRKYQSVFGERRPFVRRSDLGEKGVYFRVLLGTFVNFQDANQSCSTLKKVGGNCVVQKN